MSSYEGLAASYDALTTDVGYEKRADFLEKLFRRSRIPVHTVLTPVEIAEKLHDTDQRFANLKRKEAREG